MQFVCTFFHYAILGKQTFYVIMVCNRLRFMTLSSKITFDEETMRKFLECAHLVQLCERSAMRLFSEIGGDT